MSSLIAAVWTLLEGGRVSSFIWWTRFCTSRDLRAPLDGVTSTEESPAQQEMKEVEETEARRPGEEAEGRVGEGHVLPPWEQHSSVINLPRFDYRTPALLLDRSCSGFLITCPIKREKSATKEAISILEQLCSWSSSHSESLESSDSNVATKKRKISSEENNEEHASSTHKNDLNNVEASYDQNGKETSISHLGAGEMMAKQLDLSLVKLTRTGLILFTFTPNRSISVVNILSRIFQCLGYGDLKKPL
ncbi:hypothetical protein Taro_054738 [Colocasia esculenta]|uniref:Uncharacterized protein n=1 Tax=Colocasia esculenta TaxID=4460 RepID=A0A843XS38_COLES|nr:hypothetical protein [Colocasia esculenta]